MSKTVVGQLLKGTILPGLMILMVIMADLLPGF